jgi:hypothetical protein
MTLSHIVVRTIAGSGLEFPSDSVLAICYCYRQLANLLSVHAKYTVRKFAVQEEIQEKEAQAACPQEREKKS